MHNAPAVSYPVGRSRFQGQLTATVLMLGGLTGIGWWFASDAPGWRQGLFWACWLLTGWAGLRVWWRSPLLVLVWDGSGWHCGLAETTAAGAIKVTTDDVAKGVAGEAGQEDAAGVVGSTVRLHLDLQFFMLICVRTHSRCQWLWPERRSAPADWLALRRAVVASAAHAGRQLDVASPAMLKP